MLSMPAQSLAIGCTVPWLFVAAAHAQLTDSFSRMPQSSTSTFRKSEAVNAPRVTASQPATPLPANFSKLDPGATVTVGGKPIAVAEIRKAISAEIGRKNGPPKSIKVSRKKSASAVPAKLGTMAATSRSPVISKNAQTPVSHSTLVTNPAQARKTDDLRKLRCTHKGPPELVEVSGSLTPGGKVALEGYCFGDRTGRVELIGQFPGGALRSSFLSWDMTTIELAIPADIRGAMDHFVAVTVVGADGRRSPAMQARFVAARERVSVPADRWKPDAKVESMAVVDVSWPLNPANSGTSAKSVRVQRECNLADMEVVSVAGSVERIDGWDAGPNNEAAVNIAWRGACITSQTNHVLIFGAQEITFKSACRVALEARANADCPAGIAP